ncbi:ABC transporter permease [Solirubrobacter phytolaccae]|uniref:ABC transporter permease n=1 Tax=Solirubrobacter phytolaccae TaxID=1404360 RepID=A0A9X3NDR7_9ACTN|nr:ABC transporter permease [Solirubrobacter phytolaccae]MDA0183045.1 ABC transporter permease [Solirubrobacter phytolaccae]
MAATVLKRLAGAVLVLWATATFTFVVQLFMPGDRATMIINTQAGNLQNPSPEEIATLNERYGFDDSYLTQYLHYLGDLARGDLGVSYNQHQPVTEIIAAQIGPTIVLTVSALILAWVISLIITVLATGRDNVWSRAATGFQIVTAALPPYWIGTILLVLLAVQTGIFPVEGDTSVIGLILPALTLAIPLSGFLGQVTQDEFERVLEQPFVTSSRTRGMGDLGVRLRHVLRHAVLPAVTLSGWALGALFSGAVLIEAVFSRPGIGGILVQATSGRDIPLVTGVMLASAVMYIVANLLVDVAYRYVDPRLRTA